MSSRFNLGSAPLSFTGFVAILLATLLVQPQTVWAADPQAASAEVAPSTLAIKVIEGEGAAYSLGSRATRGLTIEVSDGTGQPVRGATVSFTLPATGASGVFANGTRTEIVMTQGDGRAAVWGMQWNRLPGQFDIRVTAAKGQARAGILSSASLVSESRGDLASTGTHDLNANSAPAKSRPEGLYKSPGGGHKWLWIGLAVGGAAAIGTVGLLARSSSSSASASTSGVTIGSPSITLGHP